ncbi:MAG UNVERIFIED_CONTAM: hypothetical protein LVR18_46550 [Planctomycetaceae bacterium]
MRADLICGRVLRLLWVATAGQSAVLAGDADHSPMLLLAVQRDAADWSAMPPNEGDADLIRSRLAGCGTGLLGVLRGGRRPAAAAGRTAWCGVGQLKTVFRWRRAGGLSRGWTEAADISPESLWALQPACVDRRFQRMLMTRSTGC